jgi:HD-GYP domain-containing protein (c-di-GMP phosphodiesterase class II)
MEKELERIKQATGSTEVEMINLPEELEKMVALRPESRPSVNQLFQIRGYTVSHCLDVANCMISVAKFRKLDQRQTARLVLGGLLHDVGKKGIDQEIIESTKKLSPAEREAMDRHARLSFDLLVRDMPDVAALVVAHHEFQEKIPHKNRHGTERRHLGQDEICPIVDDRRSERRNGDAESEKWGQVLALIDQFHAEIDSKRDYRKADSIDKVIKEKRAVTYFSASTKELLEVIADHYRRSGLYDASTTM